MTNLPDVLLQIPQNIIDRAKRLGAWLGFELKKNEYTFYINMPNLPKEKGNNNLVYSSVDLEAKIHGEVYKYYIKFRDLLEDPDFDQYIYNPKSELILYKRESTSIPLQTTDPNQLSLF